MESETREQAERQPLRIWTFLNSSFALWLLSAIFITGVGGLYTQWQNKQATKRAAFEVLAAANLKKREEIERLDQEISFRFSMMLSDIYDLFDENGEHLRPGKSEQDIIDVVKPILYPADVRHNGLFYEYRGYTLIGSEAELRNLLRGNEREEVDQSIADLSMSPVRTKTTYANRLEAGQAINAHLLPRWKGSRFAYVDCPNSAPFC